MQTGYVKVFVDWRERYRKLSDAEFGRLIRAAIAYKADGVEVELNGREELMWDGIKLDIDRDNEQYTAVCEARSEAGKRGAEIRWGGKSQTQDGKNSKSHLLYGKNGEEEEKEEEKEKDNIKKRNKKEKKCVCHQYGEYKNVLLSDEDIEKLKAEFPDDYQQRIERLSEYIAKTGKTYKSHLAVIRSWARNDRETPPSKKEAKTDGIDWMTQYIAR